MNYIECEIPVNVNLSNNLVIEFNCVGITKIEVEKVEKQGSSLLLIRFNFANGNFTEEKAIESTSQLTKDLMNLISYQFNTSYTEINTSAYCRKGRRVLYLRANITSISTMQIIQDNTLLIKEKFKNKSLLQELRSNPYHSMLREILSVNHTLSKYLLLYSLLYLLCDDSQKRVETFIKENEENVRLMERVRSDGTTEYKTIYTTLRNRIGHMNKDEVIDTLTKDMSITLNGLIRLVKIAVEKTHSKKI